MLAQYAYPYLQRPSGFFKAVFGNAMDQEHELNLQALGLGPPRGVPQILGGSVAKADPLP